MFTTVTEESMEKFEAWLHAEERSEGTVTKYMRDLERFRLWLNGQEISRESLKDWKEYLKESSFKPVTVNSMLAAINTYCRFAGVDIKIKFLRIQQRLFREESRELTREDYDKLISAAEKKGNYRLALLMEAIGSTGIRVSELQYLTVEAARRGQAQIALKGKIRDILLPGKLCRKLLKYAQKEKIASGEIFITKSGRSLSRKQIWTEMKSVCADAGVERSRVFPHNLRHLFARVFYRATRDLAKLADLLGHSSIETTRIYLLSTGVEHMHQLEILGLVR